MPDNTKSKEAVDVREIDRSSLPGRNFLCLVMGEGLFAAHCSGDAGQLSADAGCHLS